MVTHIKHVLHPSILKLKQRTFHFILICKIEVKQCSLSEPNVHVPFSVLKKFVYFCLCFRKIVTFNIISTSSYVPDYVKVCILVDIVNGIFTLLTIFKSAS